MKKVFVLFVVLIISLTSILASEQKDIDSLTIGGGYGMFSTLGESQDLLTNGPGISLTGITTFGNSKFGIYADSIIGFPLSITTNGTKVDRKNFDLLMSVDLALGFVYVTRIGNSSAYLYSGAGAYYLMLAANTAAVSTTDTMFGISLLAGTQIYITDDIFFDISARPAITFIDFENIKYTSHTSKDSENILGISVSAKAAIGYNF